MSIGSKIKQLREEKGITQTELAERIGTTKQNIYKYENGIITNIPSDKIELMAKVFEVSPAFIMGWEAISIKPDLGVKELTEIGKGLINDITDTSCSVPTDEDIKFALFDGSEGVTDEMYDEVKRFAKYIKEQNAAKQKEEK